MSGTNLAVTDKPKMVTSTVRPKKDPKPKKADSKKSNSTPKSNKTTSKKTNKSSASSIKNTMKALAVATPVIFSASNAIAKDNKGTLDPIRKLAKESREKADAHGKKAAKHKTKAEGHRANARKAIAERDAAQSKANAAGKAVKVHENFGAKEEALKQEYIKAAQSCMKKHGKGFRNTKDWVSARTRIAQKQRELSLQALRTKTPLDDSIAKHFRNWFVKFGVPKGEIPTLAQLKAASARAAMFNKADVPTPNPAPKTGFKASPSTKG